MAMPANPVLVILYTGLAVWIYENWYFPMFYAIYPGGSVY